MSPSKISAGNFRKPVDRPAVSIRSEMFLTMRQRFHAISQYFHETKDPDKRCLTHN